MDVSASGTGLRGVMRVNDFDLAALLFGLVLQEGSQLCETPRMHGPAEFLPSFDLIADIGQVLNGNHGSGFYGIDYTAAENVVAISAETVDLPCQFLEMSFGRASAFRLKTTLQPEVSVIDFFPTTFSEKLVVRADSGTLETHVHSHDFAGRSESNIGKGNDYMQPKPTLAENKIGRVKGSCFRPNTLGTRIECKPKFLPSCDSSKARYIVLHAITATVIADWRKCCFWARYLETFLLSAQKRRHRFSGAMRSGNHQLGGEIRVRVAIWVIGLLVQANEVLLLMLVANPRNCIEAFGVLAHSFKQSL